MSRNFLQQLDSRPLLGDGAMGTMIYARGIPFGRYYLGADVIEVLQE